MHLTKVECKPKISQLFYNEKVQGSVYVEKLKHVKYAVSTPLECIYPHTCTKSSPVCPQTWYQHKHLECCYNGQIEKEYILARH